MVNTEIHTWDCPECSKKMQSLYPGQLDSWKQVHLMSHERKRKDKEISGVENDGSRGIAESKE